MVDASGNVQRGLLTALTDASEMHFSARCVVRSDLAERVCCFMRKHSQHIAVILS